MGERYVMVDYEGRSETDVSHTPDGTFTRHRYKTHIDEETGQPVYGRWSPWYPVSEVAGA